MRTGRLVRARVISIAAAACALSLAGGAWGEEPTGAPRLAVPVPAQAVAPTGGFGSAWSSAVDTALSAVKGLGVVQRFVGQRLAPTSPATPPALAGAGVTTTVPAPPPEKPRTPKVGPVTLQPVAIDRSMLGAIEARPMEAVLLGASVPMPWTVP
jgi:hypothetical protein